eukprot:4821959-Prymnesium_polylepis.1
MRCRLVLAAEADADVCPRSPFCVQTPSPNGSFPRYDTARAPDKTSLRMPWAPPMCAPCVCSAVCGAGRADLGGSTLRRASAAAVTSPPSCAPSGPHHAASLR